MNAITENVVPAIIGLFAGALGSLIAPWIHWGIEKKREKLKLRKELVNNLRWDIQNYFEPHSFRNTALFSQIKPFLSNEILKELDPPDFKNGKPLVHLRSVIGRDTLTQRLLDEIAIIERKWDLL